MAARDYEDLLQVRTELDISSVPHFVRPVLYFRLLRSDPREETR